MNLKYQPCHKVLRHLFVGIFVMMVPIFAQAQSRIISGTVHDDKKDPLPGVTVSVKGSKEATTTDFTGQYKIKADSKDQLVFTYISFETATATVGDRSIINVGLKSLTSNLDEIVVIGYGSVKRKDLTGSVSSVSMADINKAPVRSFDDALAGRVAGVQVTSSQGRPGAPVDIVIRGNNSVTQSNSPLYVVDGFLIEDPNNNVINPADIASIEVLKDASATAIYGARGANGVIVIQTKKGKQGKPVFTFNSTTSIQDMMNKMDVLSPYEYVKYQLEVNPTLVHQTGQYDTPYEQYIYNPKRTLDYYKTVTPIDWQDLTSRTAMFHTNDLAIRGGTKKVNYSFSGSETDQDGILINSNYKRYQGRAAIDYQVIDKLKIGFNTNYSFLKQTGLDPSAGSNGAGTNLMTSIWGYRPVPSETRDITEEYSDPSLNPNSDYRTNPINSLEQVYDVTTTKNFSINGYLEYLLLKDLKLRSTYGIIENRSERARFNNNLTPAGKGASGVNGRLDYTNYTNWLNENTLTWDKTFGKSKFIALGGFTSQGKKSWTNGHGATQLPNQDLMFDGLDQGIPMRIDPTSSNWTMASFLTRVNYSYASKYYLTASFRADGTSKFPSENHWGYFPSGAIAWSFKNENFMKGFKALSEGKLRSSYGQTGNNRVGDFDYLTTYLNPQANTYVVNNQYVEGVIPQKLGNSSLKWETTEQIDAGIDLGFFNQRIMFTADVYRKTTKDLLLNALLPTSSGFANAQKNVGSVENKGLELTLSTKNIVTKDFTWSSSFNISFNKNKLLSLNEAQTEIQSSVAWDNNWTIPAYISKVGEPLGQMYGYQWAGTYKYSDFNTTVDSNGKTIYTLKSDVPANGGSRTAVIQPGDVKYKDLNGDGIINNKDYSVLGNGLPKHTGGFSNNFTYKGFDLNVFFQWSYGNNLINANRMFFEGPNNLNATAKNQFAAYADRWTKDNTQSDIVRVGGTPGAAYSDRFVEDGSYLRFKTAALGYTIDQKLVEKWHLKSMRFFVSAQNLYTWTNYSGPDPEVNTYRSVLTPGFDFSAYPRARTFALGTNITF